MQINKKFRKTGIVALAALAMGQFATHALAQDRSDAEAFFDGKTLTLEHVTGPGGTMDLAALLAIKYMEKYLPDDTNIILQHRPGAGGIVGTNHAVNNAPSDGTYFFMPTPSMVLLTFARPDQSLYDPMELQPIGRVLDSPRVFVARADSGIETMEDAIEHSVTHSTMPPGSTAWTTTSAVNEVLGTQFDIVAGYDGGGPMFNAVVNGEVASTTAEHGNLLANQWHLVEDGTINVLAQGGGTPVQGLEDVPLMIDFVDEDHEMRGVIEALTEGSDMGLSLFLPPDVPQYRVDYLRSILDQAMTDPELLEEVEERNIPFPEYGNWEFVQETVERGVNQPQQVQDWFYEAVQSTN